MTDKPHGDEQSDAEPTREAAKEPTKELGDEARDEARDSRDDMAISQLLKKSLAKEEPEEAAKESMLPSVQRKLRVRSKGKFYADGWSTSQSKMNYALVAVIMLVVIAACYLALGPTGFSAR